MSLRVCVLVSVGCHPRSGRPRRAPLDARAVELGLQMSDCELEVVHAGDPNAPALREYLGMGPAALKVLPVPVEADVAPTLVSYLRASKPDIVLTGRQAEGGEDSGFLPYFISHALGYSLVDNVVRVTSSAEHLRVEQALPYGQRRKLCCPLPLMLSVGKSAPAARACAFARMREGKIVTTDCEFHIDQARREWTTQPARPRPKRLAVSTSGDANVRLAAIISGADRDNRTLTNSSAAEAARVIHDELRRRQLVRPAKG